MHTHIHFTTVGIGYILLYQIRRSYAYHWPIECKDLTYLNSIQIFRGLKSFRGLRKLLRCKIYLNDKIVNDRHRIRSRNHASRPHLWTKVFGIRGTCASLEKCGGGAVGVFGKQPPGKHFDLIIKNILLKHCKNN